MKNNNKVCIKVCVCKVDNKREKLLEKNYRGVFKLENLHKWMSKNDKMIKLIGKEVKCKWNEEEIKFKKKLYGYEMSNENSSYIVKFFNMYEEIMSIAG